MKRLKILILTLVVISLAGCKYKRETEQLQISNHDLVSKLTKSDSILKVNQLLIKDFETRLDEVLSGGKNPGQLASGEELRTRLDQTITEINNLISDNQQRYQKLRNMYANANSRELMKEEEIKDLNAQIVKNDSVIGSLNLKITEFNSTVEEQVSKILDLTNENGTKTDTVAMMTRRLNTAYYYTGTADDLKNKNIIIKTGGFLGFLGRVNTLNPQLDMSLLEKIDIREKKTFTLNTEMEKVEFITHHPAGSYEIKEVSPDSTVITVNDPDKFWECSKCLVIAI